MVSDQSMADAQSEPGSFTFWFCREEWIEYFFLNIRRNTNAMVGKRHPDRRCFVLLKKITENAQHFIWTWLRISFIQGIAGVTDQVQKNLLQLLLVAQERWQGIFNID